MARGRGGKGGGGEGGRRGRGSSVCRGEGGLLKSKRFCAFSSFWVFIESSVSARECCFLLP